MNLPRSALLDSVAEASLTADVDGLLTLGAAPVSVSFATDSAAVLQPDGTFTRTTDTDAITAFLAPLTSKEIDQTPGALVGDSWLLFPIADVSSVPVVHSRATIGSTVWEVLSVGVPPLSTHYRLMVRAHA